MNEAGQCAKIWECRAQNECRVNAPTKPCRFNRQNKSRRRVGRDRKLILQTVNKHDTCSRRITQTLIEHRFHLLKSSHHLNHLFTPSRTRDKIFLLLSRVRAARAKTPKIYQKKS